MKDNLWVKILILVIVLVLFGWLLSYKYNLGSQLKQNSITNVQVNEANRINNNSNRKNNVQYIEISKNVKKAKKEIIVTDRFTGKLDPNSKIVVVGEDGNIIDVKNGAILTSGVVINSNEDSYSVYNIKNPEKSVSTEN